MTHDALAPDVSLVVPVFEEVESLPILADRIRAACDESGLTFEAWLVDDGSRDGSWAVIEAISQADERFTGIRFRRNYGKSAALAIGFERARGRVVVTLDSDLQDDPDEIPLLVAMVDGEKGKEGYDLVSGWKRTRHDPLGKTLPSRFFNAVTRHFSGIKLHDFNCGLKAYKCEVVKSVRVYGELHRYIPLLAKWEGYDRIAEKEVQHHARKFGRTKFGFERFVRGFLDLLTVTFLTRYAARPMHFFGGLGSLAFLGGFVLALWISFDKLVLGHPIGDRPLLLLAITLVIVGVQLFTTGLIGEMFAKPRLERTASYDVREETQPREAEAV